MKPHNSTSRPLCRAALCAGLLLLAMGCPKREPRPADAVKPPESPQAAPAQFGPAPSKITFVDSELHFVVLDISSRTQPPVGATLQVRRGGHRVGSVKITEEHRTHFVTADVVEGDLRIGDEAY